ncbi:unnamed protein product [Prorocentrum cordatum]|uniref:Uncharacterized protein n=1 Tax=Prorocentrum cordatum TaxID=2364126 RepID=A0ABN9RJ22_9DINO|nr:unnamed protein product [Polarella glacialis]
MALLRNAARIARAGLPLARGAPAASPIGSVRCFMAPSAPRLGHNLEDHYDMAEFMCKMHSPLGEYLVWALMFSTFGVTFVPMLHSNYYFTGRFLPKDQGNTQLCDDSW